MASIALGDMCDLARWPHGMAGEDLPRGFHLGSRGLDNMLQQCALSLVTLAATIGGMPGTTPPAAGLAIALYANHLPLCSSLCAPAILLRGHKPLVAAYAAQRLQTLPSRRLHGLVAAKLLRALRCQVLDSA
jgi:hypothetical protein